MTAKILDGNALADKIYAQVKQGVTQKLQQGLRAPGLAVVTVGDDPASKIYVTKKRQVCQEIGIIARDYDLPAATTEENLLNLVAQLNANSLVDGILVQLPLPKHINTNKIIEAINPLKDVDGFHPYNIGRLALGDPYLRSCTPKGIMTLLQSTGVTLQGLHAVIIGASNIVGRPMALELLMVNATVSICHIFTRDLVPFIQEADILIAAAGVPNLVKGAWIKDGAIVIDVGTNRLANGKIVGDVEFASAKERAGWITPVPGGVGPMTVASLMENTLLVTKK